MLCNISSQVSLFWAEFRYTLLKSHAELLQLGMTLLPPRPSKSVRTLVLRAGFGRVPFQFFMADVLAELEPSAIGDHRRQHDEGISCSITVDDSGSWPVTGTQPGPHQFDLALKINTL